VTENDREYETVFILDPTLDEAQEKEEVDKIVQWVQDLGGTMDNVERWGRRRLAYEIRKKRDGIYNILHYRAAGNHVKELERRLRLNESVMRVLSVVIDPRRKQKIEEARLAAEARAAYEAARAEAAGIPVDDDDEDRPVRTAAPVKPVAAVIDEVEKPAEATAPSGGETAG
jgi:small subunit ribosomal protein S6